MCSGWRVQYYPYATSDDAERCLSHLDGAIFYGHGGHEDGDPNGSTWIGTDGAGMCGADMNMWLHGHRLRYLDMNCCFSGAPGNGFEDCVGPGGHFWGSHGPYMPFPGCDLGGLPHR